MSINGIVQFRKNLDFIMETERFKKMDLCERAELGYRLLRSPYGLGGPFGLGGKVYSLEDAIAQKERRDGKERDRNR